jgi:hypothetical protein
MKTVLSLKPAGSFLKDRKVDGVTTRDRRYRYEVHGESSAIEQYKQDIERTSDEGDKIFPQGEEREGKLLYYTWEPIPNGVKLIRNERSKSWYADLEDMDTMNKMLKKYGEIGKLMGIKEFKKTFIPKVEEEQEETTDLENE